MAENEALSKLTALFSGLRTNSRFALMQGFMAKDAKGIGATLIIQINPDPDLPPEVYYTTIPSAPVSTVLG